MTDIPIDTTDYEHRFGKPAGRAFWSFRIVSADPAIRDHVFTTHKPVVFQEACREARELAIMRRSEKIILVPNGWQAVRQACADFDSANFYGLWLGYYLSGLPFTHQRYAAALSWYRCEHHSKGSFCFWASS
jgi:hypothetical protein